MRYLSSLIHLKLHNCYKIRDFYFCDGMVWKKNLLSLSIPGNEGLTDYSLNQLINLTELNISNNNISNACLMRLTNLKKLNIEGNGAITNKSLIHLTNLVSLSANSLISNKSLCHLTKLVSLRLYDNLKVTGASIKQLPNLTSLTLDYVNITNDDIQSLTQLIQLTIRSNVISIRVL
jgi:hypothetical protein